MNEIVVEEVVLRGAALLGLTDLPSQVKWQEVTSDFEPAIRNGFVRVGQSLLCRRLKTRGCHFNFTEVTQNLEH